MVIIGREFRIGPDAVFIIDYRLIIFLADKVHIAQLQVQLPCIGKFFQAFFIGGNSLIRHSLVIIGITEGLVNAAIDIFTVQQRFQYIGGLFIFFLARISIRDLVGVSDIVGIQLLCLLQ